MAKKKKPTTNPARGFATISLPSKAKAVEPPPSSLLRPVAAAAMAPPSDASKLVPGHYEPPTAEEEEEAELQRVVEMQGARVRREAQRLANKAETEKRTLRSTCSPLRLGNVLAFQHARSTRQQADGAGEGGAELLGEEILRRAREEFAQQARCSPRVVGGPALLLPAWTLHRAFLALGFPEARLEEALRAVMGLAGSAEKPAEVLMEDLLEWLAVHSSVAELPPFQDSAMSAAAAAAAAVPTPSSALASKSLSSSEAATPNTSGPTTLAVQAADNRPPEKPNGADGSPKGPSTSTLEPTLSAHARLVSTFALAATPPAKKLPGEPTVRAAPAPVEDSDSTSAKVSEDTADEDEDEAAEPEEDTPENLIPRYVQMRTQLYYIHPSLSPAASIKKGKSKSTSKVDRMPGGLSPDTVRRVKKLQDSLIAIERDPLFDLRTADAYWMESRLKMDVEVSAAKRARSKPRLPACNAPLKPKPRLQNPARPGRLSDNVAEDVLKGAEEATLALSIVVEDDDDDTLVGGLFEVPPTEEATVEGVNVAVRDFEESTSSTTATFGGKAGKSKGRAGVGAAAIRKVMEEVCKSRDNSAKARFEPIPGTSISNRCKLTIFWSQPSPVSPSPPIPPFKVSISTPSPSVSVFEMQALAAATREQAEGFIATYALFKLYSKNEEKLYLRLPTIWRNVWAELVELDRQASKADERQVLAKLKRLLDASETPKGLKDESEATNGAQGLLPEQQFSDTRPDTIEEKKPAYLRYLQSEEIMEDWQRRRERPSYLQMEEYRKNLPMWAFKQEILGAMEASNVIVLCGETGCGKSTQLPAFILEHELSNGRPCKVYCTEPRRISALSLAKRVSEEMGEKKGEVGGRNSLVGYAIRLESASHEGTRLIYATTGIVMRILERQPDLVEVTHLVLDEVHERSIESDFLLVVLKRLLVKRKDLKVVLMSATVDAQRFSDYLGGAPVLNVPGRTFPVTSYFLEDAIESTGFKVDDPRKARFRNHWEDNDAELDMDGGDGIAGANLQSYSPETKAALSRINHYEIQYELIVRLLEKIATSPQYTAFSHAILVFLPGLNEIRRLNDIILAHPIFGPPQGNSRSSGSWLVYPLHSTIASEDQEAAFNVPPAGVRKIVLATNIAETGITIPDVTAVIDTGKHKEMRFDEKRQLSRLVETFVARANAKQRRGRAGRVQPGICFHLFSRARFDRAMPDQQTPEIMRLSLQDLVLRVKICALGNVEDVLASALDAPTAKNIRRAVDSLVQIKALTIHEELTPLGRQLAKLPLDVYLGKLVLLGCIYGCLDATVTIAAILSSKNPFVAPIGYRSEADRAKLSFKRGNSDLLTGWNAYSSWRRVCANKGNITEADFCRKNYLSGRTLSNIEDLKGQLIAAVLDAGFLSLTADERVALNKSRYTTYRRNNFFVPPDSVNRNSENDAVVNAVVAAGFYPKLLTRDGKGWRNVSNGKIVQIHMTSVNKTTDSAWLAYYGIMQANNKFYDAHETSHVDEIALALLCGDVEFKMYAGAAIIDGNRIRFSFAEWRAMAAVKILRARLRDIVTLVFRSPGRDITPAQRAWLNIALRVFEKLQLAALAKSRGNVQGGN